ncbi:MAG: alpha-ketoacid dehydrogenase subunit beta [Alphaproteobacteria bacterium]|nr:alpha-ketoacid dehydrogenase subunit beta [Alphaproteobacteria bacterium]
MDRNPTQPDSLIQAERLAARAAHPPAELSARDAIALALYQAMQEDEGVCVLGEAVGRLGGVFGATTGLLEAFGEDRVIDLPISQAGAIGLAVGMALGGRRPVVELTGPVHGGFGQLAGELAGVAARTGGEFTAPVVLRVPYGQLGEETLPPDGLVAGLLAVVPGLTVLCPSTPGDAHALLGQALRARGPAVVLEPRAGYGRVGPLSDTPARAGQALVRREGAHVTVLAFGGGVHAALEAAAGVAEQGVQAEVLDLRSLAPLDLAAIAASVKRTGRVLVVDELGEAGQLSAAAERLLREATEAAFLYLESPPRAVSADAARIAAAIVDSVSF